jgi:hypothetical protein
VVQAGEDGALARRASRPVTLAGAVLGRVGAAAKPRATPNTGISVNSGFCASMDTTGRVKHQAMITSSTVDSPRKKAKPRTEPTVSHHSTAAPRNDEVSAARMVRNARLKARSVELRSVRPALSSSLRRSKNTT